MSSNATSEEEAALAPLLSAQSIITNPISTLSATFFLYGIYSVVFGLCIHVLFSKKSSAQIPAHKLYKICTITLFILATVYTAVSTWGLSRKTFIAFNAATTKNYAPYLQYLQGNNGAAAWLGTQKIIFTLMNSIAEIILIHRCYTIFNFNKRILYPLAFVAFVLNGIDFGDAIAGTVGQGSSSRHYNAHLVKKTGSVHEGVVICLLVFQVVLTGLTAWRLWSMACEARREGKSTQTRFNNIVTIMVESALLYAASLLTLVVLEYIVWKSKGGVIPFEMSYISTLISGLAPTMVIAQIAYSKAEKKPKSELSTFHVAENQASRQRSIATRQVTTDLHVHSQFSLGNLQEEERLQVIRAADEKV